MPQCVARKNTTYILQKNKKIKLFISNEPVMKKTAFREKKERKIKEKLSMGTVRKEGEGSVLWAIVKLIARFAFLNCKRVPVRINGWIYGLLRDVLESFIYQGVRGVINSAVLRIIVYWCPSSAWAS